MQAYEDELQFMRDQLEWIEARCNRIAAKLELARRSQNEEPFGGNDTPPKVLEARVKSYGQMERALYRRNRSRVKATTASGRRLAWLEVSESCGLRDFERVVLLLAAAPCFFRIRRTSSPISCLRDPSRLANGSSRRSALGSGASARAKATRCCCPPDS